MRTKRKSLLERYNQSHLLTYFVDAVDANNQQLIPEVDFKSGGGWFVDAIVKYGVNEKGEKLRINKPLLDAARLIGDFRISTVSTSGGAQIFKTLIHLQLASAIITIGKKDFDWTYPKANLIPKLVPSHFKPVVTEW
jgi:hypothetical protein